MCFTPYVSLSTFVIEFLLGIYFLLRNPKDKLNQVIATITLLLGFYQLNEFLICVTNQHIFTYLADSTKAILPAVAITYALIMWRKKISWYWHLLIYSPAIFFTIYFPLVITEPAKCLSIFVEYSQTPVTSKFFAMYYVIYVFAAIILFYFGTVSTKKVYEKRLFYLGMFCMFIFTVPTFIFVIFLPMFYTQIASVMCEFALLLAILLIIVIWYKEKHNLSF